MGEKIVRFYDASKNPDGGFFPGVPLRDLTEDEYEGQPDWLKRSIDAHDMYRKTNPTPAPKPTPAAKPKRKAKPAAPKAQAAGPEAAPEPEQPVADTAEPVEDGGGK